VITTGIIILAAGSSSRLGSSKQLIEFHGKTLLERVVDLCAEMKPLLTVVVLGADYESHRRVIKNRQVEITINENWRKGIGSSIKVGLKTLTDLVPEISSVLITVCDQPYLSSAHLKLMLNVFSESGKEIVSSKYGGSSGVPALFSKRIFDEVHSIDDAAGAKKIIDRDHARVAFVPFERGEVDIDTPEDLSKLRRPTN
jgi:molybdenum cofactor cytidylyltransferase